MDRFGAVDTLRETGVRRTYVDGGRTVRDSDRAVALVHRSTRALGGGFVQSSYDVPAAPDGGGTAWPPT
jgi:hypothetical protein